MAMGNLKECKGDKERVKTDCGIDPDDEEDAKKRPSCPSAAGIKKAEKARAAALVDDCDGGVDNRGLGRATDAREVRKQSCEILIIIS